jgi:hypothetical protein
VRNDTFLFEKEAIMKIIVPSTGPAVDQRTVCYVINIAKRLNTQLFVVRVLTEKEKDPDVAHGRISVIKISSP